MSNYYAWQSRIYDATRWAFLFGRDTVLDDLQLKPAEVVVEVGCGTGHNLENILKRVGERGVVFAVDCAEPMLAQCARRIRRKGWGNVRLVDREYGKAPVTGGTADVVLMSYSLSMMADWERVVDCALRELKVGGRIGVVDFCLENRSAVSTSFENWMTRNHVSIDRPYIKKLSSVFRPERSVTRKAFGGLWSYFEFIGQRLQTSPCYSDPAMANVYTRIPTPSHPSPNFNARPEGVLIDTVVLHATVLNTLEEVAEKFADPSSKVSAHYTIDRNGTIICHVAEDQRAWHAGQSRMKDGRVGVNDFSIGIELVNLNDGVDPFPKAQIEAMRALVKAITSRHPIRHIVTHYECADPPGRKSDPNGFQESWIAGLLGWPNSGH